MFAGEHSAHLTDDFRPHPHFEYLTGIVDDELGLLAGGEFDQLQPGRPIRKRHSPMRRIPARNETHFLEGQLLQDLEGGAQVAIVNRIERSTE